MEVAEQDAPAHITLQEGRGAEVTELGGIGGAGGHLQVIQRLWAPHRDGYLLPKPGAGDIGGRQQLAGSGQEFVMGKGGVEEYDKNPQ